MSNNEYSIGVFDSGVGGLTVLKQLIRYMPCEKYIYLGDTARVPYGNKSTHTVSQYANDCINFLLEKKVKLIVIACNSVSAVALDKVKTVAGNIPVIGMIEYAAIAALRTTANGNIGVIGTRATINSKAYENAIMKLAPNSNINVFSSACPLLVPLAEEGYLNHKATWTITKEYINDLTAHNIDTLILGCTHYPLFTNIISNIAPKLNLIDTGEHSAVAAVRLLADKQLLVAEEFSLNRKMDIDFYLTDHSSHFDELSSTLLGFNIDKPVLIEL